MLGELLQAIMHTGEEVETTNVLLKSQKTLLMALVQLTHPTYMVLNILYQTSLPNLPSTSSSLMIMMFPVSCAILLPELLC